MMESGNDIELNPFFNERKKMPKSMLIKNNKALDSWSKAL
jgi:hypothetical protein